jgi:hypothetical protein
MSEDSDEEDYTDEYEPLSGGPRPRLGDRFKDKDGVVLVVVDKRPRRMTHCYWLSGMTYDEVKHYISVESWRTSMWDYAHHTRNWGEKDHTESWSRSMALCLESQIDPETNEFGPITP